MIEFTLTYRGTLRPNGDPQHKHDLRRQFHTQLKRLWEVRPKLAPGEMSRIIPDVRRPEFHIPVRDFSFLPVISEAGFNVAEVDVELLQSECAGSIITMTGDIDNRLKTLFDAFKIPFRPGELPTEAKPCEEEFPFFCVLQDDHLITRVSVQTRRRLDVDRESNEVILIVHVRGCHVSEFGLRLERQPLW